MPEQPPRKPEMAEEDADAHIEKEQLQETFESPPRRRDEDGTLRDLRESSADMERG